MREPLYARICEPDNLRLAFSKAAKGKRDRSEVRSFAADLEQNLARSRRQLFTGEVCVGNYRFFTIHDPKERRICAAAFQERVLHHAILNACEPVFERHLIFDTYACRRGKGRRKALERARSFHTRGTCCLKLDIRKFFDSVPHGRLLEMLGRRFRGERRLLALLERIIHSYETSPGRGLPIGSLTSQHAANFYLGMLDRYVKEQLRVKRYVRYMDDCAPRMQTPEKGGMQCYTTDEGRPFGICLQGPVPNRPRLLRLNGRGGERRGKRPGKEPGQVSNKKMNASKPLMTYRKRREDVKTVRSRYHGSRTGENLLTAWSASGMKVA